jgi:hypothetical protein
MIGGCSQADDNYEALVKRQPTCAQGSHLEYLPWGKTGLRAVCIMEHGPIIAAEHGRIIMEGQFDKGKETGEWRWFDSSGAVVKTKVHSTEEAGR